MSKSINPLFGATGAELRARAAVGDAEAVAEINRRSLKQPVTVAQMRSRGMIAQADAKVAACKVAAPAAAPAFAKAKAAVKPAQKACAAPAKRDTIAAVRKDLGALTTDVRELAASVRTLAAVVKAKLV